MHIDTFALCISVQARHTGGALPGRDPLHRDHRRSQDVQVGPHGVLSSVCARDAPAAKFTDMVAQVYLQEVPEQDRPNCQVFGRGAGKPPLTQSHINKWIEVAWAK